MLIITVACNSDREISGLNIENEKLQPSSKLSNNDPLCLVVPQPVLLFGNQADYPKVTKSGFYSFNQPSNVLSWFYINASPKIKSYISSKYY